MTYMASITSCLLNNVNLAISYFGAVMRFLFKRDLVILQRNILLTNWPNEKLSLNPKTGRF